MIQVSEQRRTEMNYNELANEIITSLGGPENVRSVEHCSTRLRFQLNDVSKADKEKLGSLDKVAGCVDQAGGLQIIIGTDVDNVFKAINDQYSFAAAADAAEEAPADQNMNPFRRFMNNLADCFVPLIPALIAAGLMSAVVTLIQTFGWLNPEGTTYGILNIMGKAPLHFVGFMLAATAAKKFKVNPFITMSVVATLMYPDLAGLAKEGENYISFFGLPVRMASYSSAIVPVLLTVWFQRYVEKFMKRFVPKAVATFMEPLLTYFVLASVVLLILGPAASYISDGIAAVLNLVVGKYNWVVGMFLGATMILLISTGLHYSLMPIVIGAFMMKGYDTFWAGPSFASNMALAGAVLGYAVAAKGTKEKEVASSTGVTALLGITEPAIYSVALKKTKVMLATIIAGGVAGLISGILGVNSYGMAPAGLTSIAVLAGPTFLHGIITIVCAVALGFVLSFVFEKKEQAK